MLEIRGGVAEFLQKWGPYFPAFFFAGGFLFDVFFTSGLEDVLTFVQHSLYLFGTLSLTLSEFQDLSGSENRWTQRFLRIRNPVNHFILGSLLSNYFILFYRSSSLGSSFVFLLVIAGVLVANELQRVQNAGRTPRLILMLLCVLSYSLIVIPVLWGRLGPEVFAVSVMFAVLLFTGFIHLFSKQGVSLLWERKKELFWPSLGVLLFFLGSYLLKWTPPIPMAIKHIGVYHHVERASSDSGSRVYRLEYYKEWWRFWNRSEEYFYSTGENPVYLFFRVFSPARFQETLVVRWFREENGQWVNWDNISVSVSGGRLEGYRGYVKKARYQPGSWKVQIETMDGRVMGSLGLSVRNEPPPEHLKRVEIE